MIGVWSDCRQDVNNKGHDQNISTLKRYSAEIWTKALSYGHSPGYIGARQLFNN